VRVADHDGDAAEHQRNGRRFRAPAVDEQRVIAFAHRRGDRRDLAVDFPAHRDDFFERHLDAGRPQQRQRAGEAKRGRRGQTAVLGDRGAYRDVRPAQHRAALFEPEGNAPHVVVPTGPGPLVGVVEIELDRLAAG
jgi:hypothetical protein